MRMALRPTFHLFLQRFLSKTHHNSHWGRQILVTLFCPFSLSWRTWKQGCSFLPKFLPRRRMLSSLFKWYPVRRLPPTPPPRSRNSHTKDDEASENIGKPTAKTYDDCGKADNTRAASRNATLRSSWLCERTALSTSAWSLACALFRLNTPSSSERSSG